MANREAETNNVTLQILEKMHSISFLEDAAGKVVRSHVGEDTLEFFDNIMMEIKTGERKVFKVLHKLYKKEKNPLERLFFGFLCGYKVRGFSFVCRLYLYFRYPKVFRPLILAYKQHESPRDALLNILFLAKHESVKCSAGFVAKLFADLRHEDISTMLMHFHGLLDTETYIRFLNELDGRKYACAVSELDDANMYSLVTKKMLFSDVRECILLVNSMRPIENRILYTHMVRAFTEEYQREYDFGIFKRFVELFHVILLKDEYKCDVIFGWLRCFILHRRFEDFLRVFLNIKDCNRPEMNVYSSFYNCIVQYKKENILSFTLFADRCKDTEDTNKFASIPLRSLYSVYSF